MSLETQVGEREGGGEGEGVRGWQPCTRPGHHACLTNYPLQVRGRTRRESQVDSI